MVILVLVVHRYATAQNMDCVTQLMDIALVKWVGWDQYVTKYAQKANLDQDVCTHVCVKTKLHVTLYQAAVVVCQDITDKVVNYVSILKYTIMGESFQDYS